MTIKELVDRSADVFASHPTVTVLHMTTDGLAFLKKSDAETHARSYGLEVKPVLRAMLTLDDPDTKDEAPAARKTRKPRTKS